MKKNWYQSKTVQGAVIFALTGFLTQVGWLPESLVTELVIWVSGLWTVYGARVALG